MPNFDIKKVDDLIEARIRFHLFEKKLPRQVVSHAHQGAAINEACVVLMSAQLQAFVEDVFLECSAKAFGKEFSGTHLKRYKKTFGRWGNPSPENITNLFRRLGVDDVFSELRVFGKSHEQVTSLLNELNQIRNCVAHAKPIKCDGKEVRLNLSRVRRYRELCVRFSRAFGFHARQLVGRGVQIST